MDTSTLSRNDWIVVAGMALMFVAMLFAHLHVATVTAWLLTLLAAVAATTGPSAAPVSSCRFPWGCSSWRSGRSPWWSCSSAPARA